MTSNAVQLYARGGVTPSQIDQARIQRCVESAERDAAFARELGLEGLANHDWHRVREVETTAWMRAQGLTALSEREYELWSKWLPRSYIGAEQLAGYTYHEGMPNVVRELFSDVRGRFDQLEIRTPEAPRMLDPALFGHIQIGAEKKCVLLARWAESAEDIIGGVDDVGLVLRYRRRQLPDVMYFDERFLLAGVLAVSALLLCGLGSLVLSTMFPGLSDLRTSVGITIMWLTCSLACTALAANLWLPIVNSWRRKRFLARFPHLKRFV